MKGTLTRKGNIKVPCYRQLVRGEDVRGKRGFGKRHAGKEVEFDIDVDDMVLVGRNVREVKSPPDVEVLPGEFDIEPWE